MRDTIIPQRPVSAPSRGDRLIERVAKRSILSLLSKLKDGRVKLIDEEGGHQFGRSGSAELNATIVVHDPRVYTQITVGGSLGAAEAYMSGLWSCSDLTALCRILTRNIAVADDMEGGLASLTSMLMSGWQWLRRNTPRGSRRNIRAHYDLGNDFFGLFLDETMTYSCGIFERPTSSLREASIAKIDRICRNLDLGPGDHVLEIGCGWGSFAIHAAHRYGCQVTATTISQQQYELARERIRQAGLDGRVILLRQDYRDLRGRYDKLVSIEMIEAVGHDFLETFFRQCSRLLKPDGAMLLQAIVMADQRYEQYRGSVDFIKRYVFPGSCLPSISAMSRAVAKVTDFRFVGLADLTSHYAKTLRHWRARFFTRVDQVRGLGYPETLIRLWEYYLCYCEAGFEERHIGAVQLLLAKPRCRRKTPSLEQGPALSAA